ncbi:GNAT family N-acetyltransferase [Natronoglycomyces albus]|uniref:GNAT family N-acetyltransferase n=1 Tax=Natronoglycomyces albus TaxID=2811108 RepID=A0A895XP76_9ACTN|nr:GNAT family N-acetyltransferase [Natronoglycomyces albus]QSB04316.1 GNAT family N-acetyltransferase [Natronoglycomyces albus]
MQPSFVRAARTTDAATIAQLHWDVLHGPYRRLIPSEVMENLDHEWMVNRWREAIESPPDHYSRVYVAVDKTSSPAAIARTGQSDLQQDGASLGETVVGFAAVTLPEPDSGVPNFQQSAFIEPIIVAEGHRRQGHGSRLLAAAVDHWREGKIRYAYALVLAGDSDTENFLAGSGWAPEGTEYRHTSPAANVVQRRWHTDISMTEE